MKSVNHDIAAVRHTISYPAGEKITNPVWMTGYDSEPIPVFNIGIQIWFNLRETN